MASELPFSPPRLHCSFRTATILVCACNVLATLFILRSFIHPLFFNPSSLEVRMEGSSLRYSRYSEIQLKRMKESIIAWKAAKPVELIKRVKEIQQESAGSYVSKPSEIIKGSGSDLAQRLKEIRDAKKSDQEALEEWRKKKLEEARRRSQAMKAKEEDYLN